MCRAYTHGAVVQFQLGIEHFARSNTSLLYMRISRWMVTRTENEVCQIAIRCPYSPTALKLEANDHSADFSKVPGSMDLKEGHDVITGAYGVITVPQRAGVIKRLRLLFTIGLGCLARLGLPYGPYHTIPSARENLTSLDRE
jgi:hypothetical protein